MRPERGCAFEESERGVALLIPRFGGSGPGRALQRLLRLGPMRLRLDEVGSFVWRRCDGRRTGIEIAEAMRAEFGQRAEPAEERLELFLRKLLRQRLITVD